MFQSPKTLGGWHKRSNKHLDLETMILTMLEWDRINRKKDIIIEEEENNEAENQVCIWIF